MLQDCSDQDIGDSVRKAMEQVKRGRDVFHFIMPDLSCPPCVTLVVALPFVARQQLDRVGYVFVFPSVCPSCKKVCCYTLYPSYVTRDHQMNFIT